MTVPYTILTFPLINILNIEGIDLIKKYADIPCYFNKTDISVWLGDDYDNVSFVSNTNNNYATNVYTCYNKKHDEHEYVEIMIPFSGFKRSFIKYILYRLVYIDISKDWELYDYFSKNGGYKFSIRIRKYMNA